MKMNWKNLKDNRCPQCGSAIDRIQSEDYRCRCGFFCRKKRAKQIIADLLLKKDEDLTADEWLKAHGVEPEKITKTPGYVGVK